VVGVVVVPAQIGVVDGEQTPALTKVVPGEQILALAKVAPGEELPALIKVVHGEQVLALPRLVDGEPPAPMQLEVAQMLAGETPISRLMDGMYEICSPHVLLCPLASTLSKRNVL